MDVEILTTTASPGERLPGDRPPRRERQSVDRPPVRSAAKQDCRRCAPRRALRRSPIRTAGGRAACS